VFRARTARDFQALTADASAVPLACREFSRAERLLIRFDVYGGAVPSAVLLNRAGQEDVRPARRGRRRRRLAPDRHGPSAPSPLVNT
jgi:hypothetical protein